MTVETQPQVSLITVYYNTPGDLLRLYKSAEKELSGIRYEFLVADNHSLEDLTDRLSGARYLRFPKNYGFGKACNLAACEARSRNLFFVNPDCEFVEDCITPLLGKLSDFAVTAPRVLNSDGSIQLSFGPFLSIQAEAMQKFRMNRERDSAVQNWIRHQGTFSPDYVSGCAMMIRKKVFDQLGGFDEEFFLYNEDVDLCKRIKSAGGNILYLSDTKIIHHRNRSVSLESDRARQEYRKSQRRYYRKHHGPLQNFFLRLYLLISGKRR